MSRIGTPGRRLGAIAPSARRRIGGDITGHVAAATQHLPAQPRAAGPLNMTRWAVRGRRLTRCAITCWSPTW